MRRPESPPLPLRLAGSTGIRLGAWIIHRLCQCLFALTSTFPPRRPSAIALWLAQGILFFPALVGAQTQEVEPTFLQADRISGRSGAETVMEGDALLRKPGLVIQADQLEYDQLSDRAKATGHVRIQRNGARYEGTAGEVTVDAMEGFMDNMRYEFEPVSYTHLTLPTIYSV